MLNMKLLIDDTLCKGILQPYGIILHANINLKLMKKIMYARMLFQESDQFMNKNRNIAPLSPDFMPHSCITFSSQKSTSMFKN